MILNTTFFKTKKIKNPILMQILTLKKTLISKQMRIITHKKRSLSTTSTWDKRRTLSNLMTSNINTPRMGLTKISKNRLTYQTCQIKKPVKVICRSCNSISRPKHRVRLINSLTNKTSSTSKTPYRNKRTFSISTGFLRISIIFKTSHLIIKNFSS